MAGMVAGSPWPVSHWPRGTDQRYDEADRSAFRSQQESRSAVTNSALPAPGTAAARPRIESDRPHALQRPQETQPEAAAHDSRFPERDSTPTGASCGPQARPRFEASVSSWPNSPHQHSAANDGKHAPAHPLTLHIPKDPDLPGVSTMLTSASAWGYYNRNYNDSSTSLLPPFASFQEHANRADNRSHAQSTVGPLQGSCHACSKLKPLVKDVVAAVAELDESLRLLCNKPSAQITDSAADDAVRAAQWILDTLRRRNANLRDVLRATQPTAGHYPAIGSLTETPSRNMSPANTLKRLACDWDRDDLPTSKRLHVGGSPDDPSRFNNASVTSQERRSSLQYNARDKSGIPGASPGSSDSFPGSAYPNFQSPGRLNRALPSPSSGVFPSAAPSLALQTAQSIGSPNGAEAPIHSLSSDSATSAHIADLQHQVTLKSLALQTLRSEYASLLQKLQRLSVKTQAMERKSTVADQEVNELTTRNEDLTQQLQGLQEQFDDSETRREQDREKSSREKEQWLQMLDQGRRLQAKVDNDKNALVRRIETLEAEIARLQQERDISGPVNREAMTNQGTSPGQSASSVASSNAKIQLLQSVLEETQRRNALLDQQARDVVQRSAEIENAIGRALQGVTHHDKMMVPWPDQQRRIIRDETQQPSTTFAETNAALAASRWRPEQHANVTSESSLSSIPPDASHAPGLEPLQTSIQSQQPSAFTPIDRAANSPAGHLPKSPEKEYHGHGYQKSTLAAVAALPTPDPSPLTSRDERQEWSPAVSRMMSASMPPPPRPTIYDA